MHAMNFSKTQQEIKYEVFDVNPLFSIDLKLPCNVIEGNLPFDRLG